MSDEALRLEAAMRSGYTITIRMTESSSAYLREGTVFQSWRQLHAALRLAQGHCPPPKAYDKVWYVFVTTDGHVRYSGRYDLERDGEPDVLAGILEHLTEVAKNDHPRFKYTREQVVEAMTMKLAFLLLAKIESNVLVRDLEFLRDQSKVTVQLLRESYQDLAAEQAANAGHGTKTPGGQA